MNDIADLYRYFDCTEAAEFLYSCVRRTVERDLPGEIDFIRRYEQDRLVRDRILFIHQIMVRYSQGSMNKIFLF